MRKLYQFWQKKVEKVQADISRLQVEQWQLECIHYLHLIKEQDTIHIDGYNGEHWLHLKELGWIEKDERYNYIPSDIGLEELSKWRF